MASDVLAAALIAAIRKFWDTSQTEDRRQFLGTRAEKIAQERGSDRRRQQAWDALWEAMLAAEKDLEPRRFGFGSDPQNR